MVGVVLLLVLKLLDLLDLAGAVAANSSRKIIGTSSAARKPSGKCTCNFVLGGRAR